jgi:hypothetical protein
VEGGFRPRDPGHGLLDLAADVDDVGVRGPIDLEADGLAAVHPAVVLLDRIVVGDAGDVADRQPLLVDREGFDLVEDLQLAGDPGGVSHRALLDVAGRDVDVVVADGVDEVVDADGGGVEDLGLEVDVEDLVADAPDVDVGYALDPLELLGDVVLRPVEELVELAWDGYAEVDHRPVVHAEAADADLLDIVRQVAADLVDLVADLHRGQVHVRPRLELEVDRRVGGRRAGAQGVQVVDRGQDVLDGPGDDAFDLLGGRRRIGNLDHQAGEGDIGHHLERELDERDHPDGQEDQHDDDDRNGLLDREFRKVHGPSAFGLLVESEALVFFRRAIRRFSRSCPPPVSGMILS